MARTLFGQFSETQLRGTAVSTRHTPPEEVAVYIGVGTLILIVLILILLF